MGNRDISLYRTTAREKQETEIAVVFHSNGVCFGLVVEMDNEVNAYRTAFGKMLTIAYLCSCVKCIRLNL